jgi:hypothetical protein
LLLLLLFCHVDTIRTLFFKKNRTSCRMPPRDEKFTSKLDDLGAMVGDWERTLAAETQSRAASKHAMRALVAATDSEAEDEAGAVGGPPPLSEAAQPLSEVPASVANRPAFALAHGAGVAAAAQSCPVAAAQSPAPASKSLAAAAASLLSPGAVRGKEAMRQERAKKKEREDRIKALAETKLQKENEVKLLTFFKEGLLAGKHFF